MNPRVRAASAAVVLATILGCGGRPTIPPAGSEVEAAISRDGSIRAYVLVPEASGGLGATISRPYQIWLQSLRIENAQGLVLTADKTDGLRISWTSRGQLEVCYATAQITRFWNRFTVVEAKSLATQTIEVVLRRVDTLEDCANNGIDSPV